MITPLTMHDGICDFLEKKIAPRFTLKTSDRQGNDSFGIAQVVRSGWIMPKSIDSESMNTEDFPFIIPRIDKIENVSGKRESIVTLKIICGVYDPGIFDDEGYRINDGSGYRDVWNIIEAIRQAFFQNMIIDNKYMVVDDFFEAEMLVDQGYPYWEGFCLTKWHVLFPVPKLDEIFFVKGD